MITWMIPPELDQPTPRKFKSKFSFKFAVVFTFLFLVIFPLTFVIDIYYQFSYPIKVLKERGNAVNGLVIGLYTSPGKSSLNYHIKYIFSSNEGSNRQRATEGDDRVSIETYRNIQIGQAIPVIYDPRQPGISRYSPAGWIRTANWMKPLIFPGVVLMIILILGFLLSALQYFNYRKQRQLLKFGISVSARIIDETEYTVGIDLKFGRTRLSKLTYEFIDLGGKTIQGICRTQAVAGYETHRIEREGILTNPTVLFDPTNSENNILYPTTAVEAIR